MKIYSTFKARLAALALVAILPSLHAQLAIPFADGSDGSLNITSGSQTIYLTNAVTGIWTNTSAKPGNGIYDPTQWAVIFKYASVNIAAGATLAFANNLSHAPVVWLVSGNVTINGTLNLDGQSTVVSSVNLPEPGPGGFRGGGGPPYGSSSGFGPGGGNIGTGYSGNYGNAQILPLIGGSGTGAEDGESGGAGGGAILIAATGTITINGSVHANGGDGAGSYYASGGAIRLVANQISGSGTIETLAYTTTYPNGRIRLEANSIGSGLTVLPLTQGVIPANPPTIFPPTNAPTVTVLSVASQNAPADPDAVMSISPGADDLTVAATNSVTIELQTQNVPTNGTVTVFIKPRTATQTVLTAVLDSGTTNSAMWHVNALLPYPGSAVIQAHATF